VLGVVHALRIAFVELRPRVPHGLRAWTTPPLSARTWQLRDGRIHAHELRRDREGETAVEDVASGAADRQLPDAVPRILDEDQSA
jgi:hypothetical protein